jgi:hypothetical protein
MTFRETVTRELRDRLRATPGLEKVEPEWTTAGVMFNRRNTRVVHSDELEAALRGAVAALGGTGFVRTRIHVGDERVDTYRAEFCEEEIAARKTGARAVVVNAAALLTLLACLAFQFAA